jgi:hypothetical protein
MVSHLILNLKSAARKTLPESDRSVFGAHPPNRPKARGNGAIGLGSATAISVHVETHVDFGDEDQPSKTKGDPVNSDSTDSSFLLVPIVGYTDETSQFLAPGTPGIAKG